MGTIETFVTFITFVRFLSCMSAQMSVIRTVVLGFVVTVRTGKVFCPSVKFLMFFQVLFCLKFFIADITHKGVGIFVNCLMMLHLGIGYKTLHTIWTLEWFFFFVYGHYMPVPSPCVIESLIAKITCMSLSPV